MLKGSDSENIQGQLYTIYFAVWIQTEEFSMDVSWNRACAVVVVLSMMSYSQGNPILQTPAKSVDQSDTKINTVPSASVMESSEKNSNDVMIDKNPGNTIPINPGSDTAILPGQIPISIPLSVDDFMPLPQTKMDGANAGVNDISKAFTKKVLLAFFDELKQRPDLVDEIVKRETYRVLMDSDLDGAEFNALPKESDLTPEVVPISNLPIDLKNNKDKGAPDGSSKVNNDINSVSNIGEAVISKKDTQDSGANNYPKSSPQVLTGGNPTKENLKLQTALTEGLGVMPGLPNKSTTSNSGNGDSVEALNPSYYYYVYYDDNDDTSSKTKDTSVDSNVKQSDSSNVSKDQTDSQRNNIQNNMDAIEPPDTVIEKLASAVGSVISRDMENQLAKSKMTLANGSGYGEGSQTADVKVVSQTMGNSKDKVQTPADEEMELQKLAE